MKLNDIPQGYDEIPDHRFIFGKAVQHEDTTESASLIAEWLGNNNIPAYASPSIRNSRMSAAVLIPGQHNTKLVLPTDWVMIDSNGEAWVFRDFDFGHRFIKSGDPLPDYLRPGSL